MFRTYGLDTRRHENACDVFPTNVLRFMIFLCPKGGLSNYNQTHIEEEYRNARVCLKTVFGTYE